MDCFGDEQVLKTTSVEGEHVTLYVANQSRECTRVFFCTSARKASDEKEAIGTSELEVFNHYTEFKGAAPSPPTPRAPGPPKKRQTIF